MSYVFGFFDPERTQSPLSLQFRQVGFTICQPRRNNDTKKRCANRSDRAEQCFWYSRYVSKVQCCSFVGPKYRLVPRKLFVFIISKKHFYFILKKEALVRSPWTLFIYIMKNNIYGYNAAYLWDQSIPITFDLILKTKSLEPSWITRCSSVAKPGVQREMQSILTKG